MIVDVQSRQSTGDTLVERIRRLEGFMSAECAWDLRKLGLECGDLEPSLAQVSVALVVAQRKGPTR